MKKFQNCFFFLMRMRAGKEKGRREWGSVSKSPSDSTGDGPRDTCCSSQSWGIRGPRPVNSFLRRGQTVEELSFRKSKVKDRGSGPVRRTSHSWLSTFHPRSLGSREDPDSTSPSVSGLVPCRGSRCNPGSGSLRTLWRVGDPKGVGFGEGGRVVCQVLLGTSVLKRTEQETTQKSLILSSSKYRPVIINNLSNHWLTLVPMNTTGKFRQK